MSIISGPDAKVVSMNPNRYQEGVYSLAKTIERIMTFAFFDNRLAGQLKSGKLSGLDYEQARFSQIACYDMHIVELHKLVDIDKNAWSLRQLFKEWKQFEHSEETKENVLNLVTRFEKKLTAQTVYRHEKVAHQNKKIRMTELTTHLGDIQVPAGDC